MKFDQYNISPLIKQSLEELGFRKPTDIQYKAIPSILKGDDVLAIAQTGTGKTAAFAIPVLHILLRRDRYNVRKQVKCLVMVPTRELAMQITEVFKQIGKHTPLQILGLVGGVAEEPQIKKLEKGVDILIATPGRMFDLCSRKIIDLSRVDILVLDEADHMLDLGFIKDIRDVQTYLPPRHQTLFFSATIDEQIKSLAYSLVRNAIRIQISPKDPVSKNVQHSVAYINMDDKRFFLERLIREMPEKKILVFVRTKVRAERVHAAMNRVGIETITMHGDKEQADRMKVMRQFRDGQVQVLIATDVSARGIDIPGVEYVVNYDIPDVPENYVHRVGRTGRGTAKGIAVSFCAPEEKPLLQAIESYITKPITVMDIDKEQYVQTITFTEDIPNTNWQALLDQDEKEAREAKRKKNKK